jgi:endonuclease/exonuclease/phosphatase (EEP) superfamily protein YafD
VAYIIGVYAYEKDNRQILREVEKLIKGIRRKHSEALVILFGDFNVAPTKTKELSKGGKLTISKENLKTITRTQIRGNTIKQSTLDYFAANLTVKSFRRISK